MIALTIILIVIGIAYWVWKYKIKTTLPATIVGGASKPSDVPLGDKK
jgi:hypothetical protein